ncbi:DUF2851 family protein [Psychroflexus sediminis]|uniref:DUF2851 domain-containing protein n=1 Tax=Psychroflexus sediminis TaxID=470826 RepID=A0A1G7WHY8_9FLAO|nr:DUF2851 family protein [Psychroflexus sediminis]SDG71647.1 Protein of unknown function [Psychroflexus sediminis]
MQEAFLHSLWKYKKLNLNQLQTTRGEELQILQTGLHNETESGPDFFKAEINLGGQHWVGNLEIHLRSSDWYAHHHETDPAYDNVILHVVWEDDMSIFRKDETEIPCLELKSYISNSQLQAYHELFENIYDKWINCETHFGEVDEFKLISWLERLYIERLEDKNELILNLLRVSNNNWDEVGFKLMAKAFGLNVNGDAFMQMSSAADFKVFQKCFQNPLQLEALCFGLCGMLPAESEEAYVNTLQKEFVFLEQKFQLAIPLTSQVKYFRLRPDNFPSIRLSQFCDLYSRTPRVFAKLIQCKTKRELYDLLEAKTSGYWESHYSFGKKSKAKIKKISRSFKDLLIINTILPLKFAYDSYKGQMSFEESIYPIISTLKPEMNSITKGFEQLKPKLARSALESQALIQLKSHYCDLNRCLKCQVGLELIHA